MAGTESQGRRGARGNREEPRQRSLAGLSLAGVTLAGVTLLPRAGEGGLLRSAAWKRFRYALVAGPG